MPRVENGRRPAGYYFRARANERQLSMLSDEQFEELAVANPQRRLVPTDNMLNLAGAPDLAYIERWTQTLNLSGQWQEN